ncbi:hypothetical protein HGRIS_006095 [Hohenbuehelia grisea]|uniref:F-box domain-containing protein n=1 Tax=Hohenbuehelia grisea TaxID=104357 RepID=A0ABR3K1H1_9AGAR
MHRCLYIQEIVCAITGFLYSSPNPRRRALASMAQTCQALKEPALNQLWYGLDDSLLPLLKLFPGDLWIIRLSEGGDGTEIFHFTRVLQPEDWDRFTHYAVKIRRIVHCYDPTVHPTICHSAFLALSVQRSAVHGQLLPNLKMLRWKDSRPDVLSFIRLFIHEKLVMLRIGEPATDSSTETFTSLLKTLPISCPHLIDLSVRAISGSELSFMTTASCSSRRSVPFARMKRLILCPPGWVSAQGLRFIGSLEYLQEAMLMYNSSVPLAFPSGVPQFTSLRQLCVAISYLSERSPILELIDALSPTVIETLRLSITTRCAPSSVYRVCIFIAKLSSLKHLRFFMDWVEPPPDLPSYTEDFLGLVQVSHIAPLRALPHLEVLEIISPALSISNQFIHAIARAPRALTRYSWCTIRSTKRGDSTVTPPPRQKMSPSEPCRCLSLH